MALDPDNNADDDLIGPTNKTPHGAHLELSEGWEVGDREVILQKRTVRETEWAKVEG